MSIRAFAALAAKTRLQPFEYEPPPLGPHDVEIAISHCGVCHTDLHYLDNDWVNTVYPLVPGHEIVGVINMLGTAVEHLHAGQRVGVGYQANSCLTCEWCLRGQENLCQQKVLTCQGRHGGYANALRVDSRFVFPIPDTLASENTAPLLCAGVTVYSAMALSNLKAQQHIGVLGIGGLGHIALQFARALGYEVTAFSTSPDKEADAYHLGAHHFVYSQDFAQMRRWVGSLDMIISTVTAPLDWVSYLALLRPNGRLHFVGSLAGNLNIPTGLLIAGQKTISGNLIGSRARMGEMLKVAARHGIQAQTKLAPLAEVNEVLETVRHHKARYRMVLTTGLANSSSKV